MNLLRVARKLSILGLGASLALAGHRAQAEPQWFSDWEFGATGESIFEHTRAGLRDPHFGMRFYCDDQVPGTLNKVADPKAPGADATAALPNGNHKFLDVVFGEKLPLFTWFNVNPHRSRYARGVQVNLEAAVFMLLDLTSQSSGVIDADFRIGGSVDLRPPLDGWEHLSLSVGFFHESTHLGDEYVLSVTTIQGNGPPLANPALPYRANPSYQSMPVTLSIDSPAWKGLTGRLYGGASRYFGTSLPNGELPSEWRAGAELRWNSPESAIDPHAAREPSHIKRALNNLRRRSSGLHSDEPAPTAATRSRHRRGTFSVEAAYELLAKRKYQRVGPAGEATFESSAGDWYIHHALVMGLYNLDTERSSSNAFGVSLDVIHGQSPFGQLTEYTRVSAVALALSYYW